MVSLSNMFQCTCNTINSLWLYKSLTVKLSYLKMPDICRYFLWLLNLVKLGGEWVRYYRVELDLFTKLHKDIIWHQLRKEILPYLVLEGWNWNILFFRGLWSFKFLLIKSFAVKCQFKISCKLSIKLA